LTGEGRGEKRGGDEAWSGALAGAGKVGADLVRKRKKGNPGSATQEGRKGERERTTKGSMPSERGEKGGLIA